MPDDFTEPTVADDAVACDNSFTLLRESGLSDAGSTLGIRKLPRD